MNRRVLAKQLEAKFYRRFHFCRVAWKGVDLSCLKHQTNIKRNMTTNRTNLII